jgi:hypothetical protein
VVEAGSLDVSETLQLKPSEDVPSKPAEPLPSEDLGIAQSEASSELEICSDLFFLYTTKYTLLFFVFLFFCSLGRLRMV